MIKNLFLLVVLTLCGVAFAGDASRKEDVRTVYREMPDGTSKYIGKCSLHDVYLDEKFKVTDVIVEYFEPSQRSFKELKKVLRKLDPVALRLVLNTFGMFEVVGDDVDNLTIMSEYVDDITVDRISFFANPSLDLIRFNLGVGGGNGGYVVLSREQINKDNFVYNKMSYTFDGDVNYCDEQVWDK